MKKDKKEKYKKKVRIIEKLKYPGDGDDSPVEGGAC